jgi:hypothetical protein
MPLKCAVVKKQNSYDARSVVYFFVVYLSQGGPAGRPECWWLRTSCEEPSVCRFVTFVYYIHTSMSVYTYVCIKRETNEREPEKESHRWRKREGADPLAFVWFFLKKKHINWDHASAAFRPANQHAMRAPPPASKALNSTCFSTRRTRFQILHIFEFHAHAADLALAHGDSEARHVWAGQGGCSVSVQLFESRFETEK